MAKKYLTLTRYERNSSNGLELHESLESAGDTITEDKAAGALSVRLFEVNEVDYEAYTVTKTELQIMPLKD
jgi:hypothetical protein